MMNTGAGANMLLIHSNFGERKSFRLIPIKEDCPYAEALYDPDSKVLVLISKIVKQSMHMIPKLNNDGDPDMRKMTNKPRQERKVLETFYEYYMTDRRDIDAVINLFAANASDFNYAEYLDQPLLTKIEQPKIITDIHQ